MIVAEKTLKWSGRGSSGTRWFLVLVGIPLVWGFRVFGGVLIDGIRADGGADPGASHALIVGIGGTAMLLVMAVFWVVAFFRAGGEAGYPEGIGGLNAWAAQHGWEVADDGRLASIGRRASILCGGPDPSPRRGARSGARTRRDDPVYLLGSERQHAIGRRSSRWTRMPTTP